MHSRSRWACFVLAVAVVMGVCLSSVDARAAGLIEDEALRLCIADALSTVSDEYTPDTANYQRVLDEVNQTDLDVLAGARRLVCEGVVSIEGLQNVTNPEFTTVHLSGGRLTDISSLSGFTKLHELSLINNRIKDITPLASMTLMENLVLAGNQISDLTPLSGLTKLEQLELGVNDIADLTPLAGLTFVHRLSLMDNKVSNVEPLAEMQNMGMLDISDNQISDVSSLSNLTRLYHLELGGNKVSDLSLLSEMANLQILSLKAMGLEDLAGLESLSHLSYLDLSNNKIVDIGPLAEFSKLYFLDLSGNLIEDPSPIAELRPSDGLYLHNNLISDLTSIADLINCVNGQGNPCTIWTLEGNAILDASPVSYDLVESLWSVRTEAVGKVNTFSLADQVLRWTPTLNTVEKLPTLVSTNGDTGIVTWSLGSGDATLDVNDGTVSFQSVGLSTVKWRDQHEFFSGTIRATIDVAGIKGQGSSVAEVAIFGLIGIAGIGVILVLVGVILLIARSIRKRRHRHDHR